MTKHTPAPWKVNEKTATVYVTQEQYGEIDEPAVSKAGDTLKFDESLANARLIAAAPELLEALKAINENGGVTWDYATIGNIARAAIAKAEGS